MSVIYIDMDGVIADFFGGIAKKCGVDHWKSIQDRDKIFVELRNPEFFYTLDTFHNLYCSTSDLIVEHVKDLARQNGIEWGICSSPLRGDHNNSAYWKRRWLEDYGFMPPLVENCVFTSNKHKYAWNEVTHRPNILIDDRPDNIRRWIEAGGIGIVFQCDQDDLETLFKKLEIAIERARTFELKNAV